MQEIQEQIQHKEISCFKVFESQNISEIEEALNSTLYVPEAPLKPRIIFEILHYLKLKFELKKYPINSYIATNENGICGMVICQLDPHYTSYSRKCGTFGWLNAESLEVCEELMRHCAIFVRKNKVRKLRGPINCPKSLGGIGHQVEGFEWPMLYGVAYTDPTSRILDYLVRLGYIKESQYSCVRVDQAAWANGKKVDKDIRLELVDIEGFVSHKEEILNLGKDSFHEILPDASGRQERFDEFVYAYSEVPKANHLLPEGFDFYEHSDNPHFIETWENCDIERIIPIAPLAFDRHTGELVGALLGLPDIFEAWLGKKITRANADTAMVRKDYTNKGIFSAMNNVGQQTARFLGWKYFEGTSIWSNNSHAIDTIFPHCTPIRKHYIVQKRV